MEQLIIILIFIVISIFNWLSKQAEEKRARDELEKGIGTSPTSEEGDFSEGDRLAPPKPQKRSSEEEQIRKFFEALGLPSDVIEPPPTPAPPPQPIYKTAPQASQSPQKSLSKAPAKVATSAPQTRPVKSETLLTKEEQEALERIKAGKPSAFTHARPSMKTNRISTGRKFIDETVALLSNPTSARKAILLREILDRPVALRENPALGRFYI